MVMTELQNNSRQNIIDTLELFASKDAQLEFQRRVPFVDVSTELFCHWDSHYIVDQPWFLEAYSSDELKAMADFKKTLEEVYASFNKLPPIQEFVLTAEWARLSKAAAVVLDRIESAVENKSS
jgi:hypothetical protein